MGVLKRRVKPRSVRKLEKSGPRRFMNPFLCFAHEERVKAKNGHLLSEWKAAHRGLASKWRALGAGRAKFGRQGKMPPFAAFVKESPQRKDLLPSWRNAHRGLGARWKALDKNYKAKYVDASKKMKSGYEQQMKVYRSKRIELLKQIRARKSAKKALRNPNKTKASLKKKSKKQKKRTAAPKQKSKEMGKSKKVAKRAVKKSKKGMKGVARKINARIRMTSVNSRSLQ